MENNTNCIVPTTATPADIARVVEELVDDAELRAGLGAGGREYVTSRGLVVSEMVAHYERVYRGGS
jgi:hypothetical protein